MNMYIPRIRLAAFSVNNLRASLLLKNIRNECGIQPGNTLNLNRFTVIVTVTAAVTVVVNNEVTAAAAKTVTEK